MMVEQMVSSNLSKYGLGKCASITTSSDKQTAPLVSVKTTTLRDVQSENKNKNGPLPRSFDNSSLQKDTLFTQARSPPSTSNVNGNLVYARRKSDSELSNPRVLDKNQTSGLQQSLQREKKFSSPQPETKNKVNNSMQPSGLIPLRACGNEPSAIVNSSAIEQWSSRFVQLQTYLKQCDSSNPEVYVQKLRTFSPDEYSRHAVELERRAIQLMLEEGREIQRVKDLNLLAGNYSLRPLTPVFKSENH